jgi:hypothetical protein
MFESDMSCFYGFPGISLMRVFDENWCMDLIGAFPGVVAFGVTLPFDQILQGLAMPLSPVSVDLFHLIFFFPINQIRGWSGKVGSM